MYFANRPHIKITPPGPKAKKIWNQSKRHIASCIPWAYPLVAERGSGIMIEDADGNCYYELYSWKCGSIY